LLGNEAAAPVLELLGLRARLRFECETWIAVAGAGRTASTNHWRAVRMGAEELLSISEAAHGLWTYIAVEGGFEGPQWLGSVSGQGKLQAGDVLRRSGTGSFSLPAGVSSRVAPWTEQRDYGNPPGLRVWPAPQWESFSEAQRDHFFAVDRIAPERSQRLSVARRTPGA
jgi:allophanate hydrolase subunit 2